MTIDEMIDMLGQAKKELGGDKSIAIHLHCNGNGDVVDIEELSYSRFLGLRFEVSPPWWIYPKDRSVKK